jgi:NAD-dependent epimerase/dehydratase family protein
MRLLVLGAGGVIGSAVARESVTRGHDVHGLLRPSTSAERLHACNDILTCHRHDLEDIAALSALIGRIEPQAIVHAAFPAGHARTHETRLQMLQHGLIGSLSLLEALSRARSRANLVYLGSAISYGATGIPHHPSHRLQPGLGVPDRIRKLPWGGADGVRTISFTAARDLPWPLLGMLNVAKALIISNEFFKNRSADGGLADVARVQVIDNPERVVPRAFLAGSAEGVADAEEASNKIFDGAKPRDVQQHSFVEGLPAPAVYEAQGEVAVTGSGDRLEFDVSGSSGHRLLVVNELYFSGWRAFVDGSETPLLAANAVMRAVVLPPSARSVVMTYEPFARGAWAIFLYVFGAVLLILGLLVAARAQNSQRSAISGCKTVDGARALEV